MSTEIDRKEKEDSQKGKQLKQAALNGAAAETVQRYGSAVKEYNVAYSGVDNEAGKKLTRGLKDIAKSKVHPDYRDANLKQQAGFSAEVLDTADTNAEYIIRKSPVRKIRTDDLKKMVDPHSGKPVGGTNDTLFDHVELDKHGNIIPSSAAQMKFVGKTPEDAYNKLMSPEYQKYFDTNAKIEVPSDQYNELNRINENRLASLEKQYQRAKASGKDETAAGIQKKIEKCRQLKRNLKKSTVSNQDAVDARTNPLRTTAGRMAKVAHRAGVEQAKLGAAISGSLSLIQNTVAVLKGEKKADEAAWDVCQETGKAAVASYATAFSCSILKGTMQNAGSSWLRNLSKTNLPAVMLTTTLDMGKAFKGYLSGEIDGLQCLEALGQSGVNQLSSAMFATIGQIVIPIPVVGAIIGAMAGCALSSACYSEVVTALKEARLAREERLRIEAECERLIEMTRAYRLQAEAMVERYLCDHLQTFHQGFQEISRAMQTGDTDSFMAANAAMQEKLGHQASFSSFPEFDALMQSNTPLKL
ncbi:MAG: hypothetical protein NC211_00535 [Alistipes senegalensis]|nr:hypothetical protein [Oxalobacter formigenes]MCM1280312.1 hypothetical protein [Alistipes senegalensis]